MDGATKSYVAHWTKVNLQRSLVQRGLKEVDEPDPRLNLGTGVGNRDTSFNLTHSLNPVRQPGRVDDYRRDALSRAQRLRSSK